MNVIEEIEWLMKQCPFDIPAYQLSGPVYRKVWYDPKSETFKSRILTRDDMANKTDV
jgi:hypothetical protein